jgi:DNA-binding transcriptional LysR family regulator
MVGQQDIEILLTLAQELHFGRIAERLHVSTARVSRCIRKWERRVGLPLFERTSRRVLLTPVGRQLHEDIGPAYQLIQDGIQRAVDTGRETRGLLAVSARHRLARRTSVPLADADTVLLEDPHVPTIGLRYSCLIGPPGYARLTAVRSSAPPRRTPDSQPSQP